MAQVGIQALVAQPPKDGSRSRAGMDMRAAAISRQLWTEAADDAVQAH